MLPPIIFIFNGRLPKYGYDSLIYNKKNNKNDLILICNLNQINKKKIKKDIHLFEYNDFKKDDLNFISKYKLDEFWTGTVERYFVLNNFTAQFKIKKFFHAELDNILNQLGNLSQRLDRIEKKIFLPSNPLFQLKKSNHFTTGSFIYINNRNYLNSFCNFAKQKLKKKNSNDMQLLSEFSIKYKNKVGFLPTISSVYNPKLKNLDFKKIGGIFDEARIGQFLFGIDPRHEKFFLYNRSPILQPNYDLLNNLKFKIKKKFFYLLFNNEKIYIYNFHVHSKLINKIFIKKFYIKIIKNVNKNKSTLLSFNLKIFFSCFKIYLKIFFIKLLKFFTPRRITNLIMELKKKQNSK